MVLGEQRAVEVFEEEELAVADVFLKNVRLTRKQINFELSFLFEQISRLTGSSHLGILQKYKLSIRCNLKFYLAFQET